MVRPLHILLAEGNGATRRRLEAAFVARGMVVVAVASGAELSEYIGSSILFSARYPPPEVIISDVRMSGGSRLQVLAGLRRGGWGVPVVLLMTWAGYEASRFAAERVGASAVFVEPFDVDELFGKVLELCLLGRALRALRPLQNATPRVAGVAVAGVATRRIGPPRRGVDDQSRRIT